MGGSGGGGGGSGKALALVALLLAVPGTLVSLNELNTINLYPNVITEDDSVRTKVPGGPDAPCGVTAPAEIVLSTDKARRGDSITVSGSCFHSGERVAIRVHVTEVGSATADSQGGFVQAVTVPQSGPPPGFPTSVAATGKSSVKTATAPFATTG